MQVDRPKQLNIQVGDKLAEALRVAAFEQRTNQSDIVRKAIIAYLNIKD